jgi:hypothetical protein
VRLAITGQKEDREARSGWNEKSRKKRLGV